MKRILSLFTLLVFTTFPVYAEDKKTEEVKVKKQILPIKEDVPQYLQDISVTIRAGNAEGSGIITNIGGESYILTCGHVVAHLREAREIVDSASGVTKTVIDWNDAEIGKEFVEDGRTVAQLRLFAYVIRYSDADHGEDLAVLKVRKKDVSQHRVVFYSEEKIPSIGSDLYHVGSLLGQGGSNSMTSGIYSQHGRILNGKILDQTSCAAFRGSSGGGVYLKDGRYIGMIVRGAGETFNLIVPIRRINDWAKKTNIEWLINPNIPMPKIDEEWLKKYPIEDNHHGNSGKKEGSKSFKFLIREN